MDVRNAITKPLGRGLSASRSLTILMLIAACVAHEDAAAQAPSAIPEYPGQVMLIKNTLTAVNHGNITGNYTVLRDLASAQFRQQNTAADLAVAFAKLRQQKLDLSPILVTEPKLTGAPAIDEFRGRLQLVGYVPTRPRAVQFALIFQHVKDGWVIDEISVVVAPTESVVGPQRTPQPPQYTPRAQQPRTALPPNTSARPGT